MSFVGTVFTIRPFSVQFTLPTATSWIRCTCCAIALLPIRVRLKATVPYRNSLALRCSDGHDLHPRKSDEGSAVPIPLDSQPGSEGAQSGPWWAIAISLKQPVVEKSRTAASGRKQTPARQPSSLNFVCRERPCSQINIRTANAYPTSSVLPMINDHDYLIHDSLSLHIV